MSQNILNHYLEFSAYTNPGLYKEKLQKDLPDDIREIGLLVRQSIIHRSTLASGNTGTNADLRFGDMDQVPWYRQPEDDILVTAAAMIAELYRRNPRGFVPDRKPEDKLVVTCRFVAILMAAILKSKGIPARVRSGNAPYFDMGDLGEVSTDHWITQYWQTKENRWVTVDVDGSLSLKDRFDPYDVPEGKFDFPAHAWLDIRAGKADPQRFYNAKPERGAIVVLWSLAYDFHCLMGNEIIYEHGPVLGSRQKFADITEAELEKFDHLARLMQDPDGNFDALRNLWETERSLRLLVGGLLWDSYKRGLTFYAKRSMTYQPQYEHVPPIKWAVLTPLYDFFCRIVGFGRGFRRKVLAFGRLKDGVAADIGCGTGVFLKVAKQGYPDVAFIGVDPDAIALSIAKRRLDQKELNVELKQAFAEALPFSDASIDVCFSTLAFHHVPNDIKKKAAQEMYRVLKPGGRVVIADFGERREGVFMRFYMLLEKHEYIAGNLKGLIPKYLRQAGFRNVEIAGKHFPAVDIVTGQKVGE